MFTKKELKMIENSLLLAIRQAEEKGIDKENLSDLYCKVADTHDRQEEGSQNEKI